MRTLARILFVFYPLVKRLSVCGSTGFIAGAMSGYILTALGLQFPAFQRTDKEALIDAIVFTLFTWIIVLYILCVLARYLFRTIALPSLFNCFITCLLTSFATKYLDAYQYAWVIGMLIGILVGSVLCRINSLLSKK